MRANFRMLATLATRRPVCHVCAELSPTGVSSAGNASSSTRRKVPTFYHGVNMEINRRTPKRARHTVSLESFLRVPRTDQCAIVEYSRSGHREIERIDLIEVISRSERYRAGSNDSFRRYSFRYSLRTVKTKIVSRRR